MSEYSSRILKFSAAFTAGITHEPSSGSWRLLRTQIAPAGHTRPPCVSPHAAAAFWVSLYKLSTSSMTEVAQRKHAPPALFESAFAAV